MIEWLLTADQDTSKCLNYDLDCGRGGLHGLCEASAGVAQLSLFGWQIRVESDPVMAANWLKQRLTSEGTFRWGFWAPTSWFSRPNFAPWDGELAKLGLSQKLSGLWHAQLPSVKGAFFTCPSQAAGKHPHATHCGLQVRDSVSLSHKFSQVLLSLHPEAQSAFPRVFPSLSLRPPVFLLCSSLCPSISPFLAISPDPLLILILLPHSSITHFSHFCIYAKDDGLLFVFKNPPKKKAQSSNPPNIDLPNLYLVYHPLLYMMSSFPVIFSESEGVGNEDWDGGGANPHPFSSSELKMVQVSSQVGVAKMWDYLLFCVVFNPQKPHLAPPLLIGKWKCGPSPLCHHLTWDKWTSRPSGHLFVYLLCNSSNHSPHACDLFFSSLSFSSNLLFLSLQGEINP